MQLEKIARDTIRAEGMACEFYTPEQIPRELVTVKRTARPGSTRFRGSAMVTVQAWSTSRGRAEALCMQAVDALVGRGEYEGRGLASADDDITGCIPENGPYRWDDPEVKDRSRWQATVAVDYNA